MRAVSRGSLASTREESIMTKLVAMVFACCMSFAAGSAWAQETKKDEARKEMKKGEMKKEEMMKDMSKGEMSRDEDKNKRKDSKKKDEK